MPETTQRPIPLLADISLEFIQRIEHRLDGGFTSSTIPGMAGELQQRLARPSHRIHIHGILMGEGVSDQVSGLQRAAADGEELTFTADITSALDIQNVVIDSFRAIEDAAVPGRYVYEIALTESPSLPPPAELSGFGGLDDFGLGDLGFDKDIMGDLEDLAGDIADAANEAMGAIEALGALAELDGLSVGGVLQPMQDAANSVSPIASGFKDAMSSLGDLFG